MNVLLISRWSLRYNISDHIGPLCIYQPFATFI